MKKVTGYFLPIVVALIYLFLYIPIVVLVVFSFNDDPLGFQWVGFTNRWYYTLFETSEVWEALQNSLIVAFSSVFLSICMASLFVFYATRVFLNRLLLLFYANLAVPEIVLAVGLLSFFYFFAVPLSMSTLIAGHTLIGLGYAVPIIYTRFIDLDKSLIEASLDLGATQMQTFYKVVLPLISPALIASAMLVFIISFDDFILSFFCAGAATQTLPLYIFSMIRAGASPVVGALSTLLLLVSSILILIFFSLQIKKTDLLR